MEKLPRYLRGSNKYFDAKAWAFIEGLAKRKKTGSPSNSRKGWETRRRNMADRRAVETGRRGAEHAAFWRERVQTRGKVKWHVLNAMEPGAWYALTDVAELAGVPVRDVKSAVNMQLLAKGALAKVDNPAWQDLRDAKGFKVWTEPKYLYGLTEAGLGERTVARSELAARGWPKYRPT